MKGEFVFELQLKVSKQGIVPTASAKLFEEMLVNLLRRHAPRRTVRFSTFQNDIVLVITTKIIPES